MKKVISLILALTMLIAMVTVSFNAYSVSDEGALSAKDAVEAEGLEPGNPDDTQRIYFQMPNGNRGGVATKDVSVHHPDELDPETGDVITPGYDEVVIHAGEKAPSWYSDYNVLDGQHYAGAYWWGGTAACDSWCGYRAEIADYDQGIYYVDVPKDVVIMIWNNGVDGGTDSSEPIYYEAAQTVDANIEGAFEGDYDSLPYGSPDPYFFDNCIYVIDPNQVSINAFSQKQTCGGNWYVYYGDGCYGSEFPEGIGDDAEYPDGTPDWSDDMQDVCLNPDHFVDGVHVGYHEDAEPTEAPQPTEAPTEAPHVHTPAAAVQENVVEATSCAAGGSYDSVVYCSECGEELSRDTVYTDPLPHNSKSIKTDKEVPATIFNTGVAAHYHCNDCGKLFSDKTATIEVTEEDLILPVNDPDPTSIYFNVGTTGWNIGSKKVGFYVFSKEDGELIAWGGKKLQGFNEGNGVWSYNPAANGMAIEEGKQYKIIFTGDSGQQTYDLIFDTTCFGYEHIAYCDGTEYENPVDSSQKTLAAFWTGIDASEYGPVLQVSSIGTVIGTCPEEGATPETIFADFLVNTLANARAYQVDTGVKTEQQLIDDIATGLGLSKQDVYDAFEETGVESTWDYTQSTLSGDVVLPTEPPVPTEAPTEAPQPTEAPDDTVCGDIDGNGEVDIVDVTVIQRILADIIPADAATRARGDVDKSGDLEIIDATFIQRFLVGIDDGFGIGALFA